MEAAYGVNVLKYTETVPATSGASLASEIIRGLGYWYFYGSDRLGPWTQASVAYTQNLWLIGASFAVPVLCFIAAVFSRWRYRAYFVLITVVGMVLAVGPNPYADPSTVGSAHQVVPGGHHRRPGPALHRPGVARGHPRPGHVPRRRGQRRGRPGAPHRAGRRRRSPWPPSPGATVPLWTGAIIANGFTQPAAPPLYVRQAAAALDTTHPGTRVYALPGNNFAAYRWGDTIDTVYPGLMTRPFVTHEQQIMGSLATADLLQAVDTPLQDGTMDWNALAPMASLMSAGDVLVQYDQAYERYDTRQPPAGGRGPGHHPARPDRPGLLRRARPNVPLVPHFDEAALARPPNQGWPAPLVSYTVADPRPIVRTESTTTPLVVDGDASGIVNAASVGLLAGNPTHPLRRDPRHRPGTAEADPRRAGRPGGDRHQPQAGPWSGTRSSENTGVHRDRRPGTRHRPTRQTNRSTCSPRRPADAQSTAVYTGIASVTASSYGSLDHLPARGPARTAPSTATPRRPGWTTPSPRPQGQWWQVVAGPSPDRELADR